VAHIATQTPAPHLCPAAHCAVVEHPQNPSVHSPAGPHWESSTHVPQVPSTQAWPPPHWLLAVHGLHTPLMHAYPLVMLSGPSLP
jgi:hypothetical protein